MAKRRKPQRPRSAGELKAIHAYYAKQGLSLSEKAHAALDMIAQGKPLFHGAEKRKRSFRHLKPGESLHIGSEKAANQFGKYIHELKIPKSAKILLVRHKQISPDVLHSPTSYKRLVKKQRKKNVVGEMSDLEANARLGSYGMYEVTGGSQSQSRSHIFPGVAAIHRKYGYVNPKTGKQYTWPTNRKRSVKLNVYRHKLRKRLADRGYVLAAYYNSMEDPGHVSYVVLNPKKVKIKRTYTNPADRRR